MPQVLDLTFTARPEAVAVARHASAEAVEGLSERAIDNVRLIVSELVTNAIRHGPAGEVTLRLRREGDLVRGEVEDEGGGAIELRREPRLDPRGGFGLHVVEAFSDRWGFEADRARVWFELRDENS